MKISTVKLTLVSLLLIIGIASFFALKNHDYTATDILEDANFNTEYPAVTVHQVDSNSKSTFHEIKLTKKTQQELLEAFHSTTFEKASATSLTYDYRIEFMLAKGYVILLDTDNKKLTVSGTNEHYAITSDNAFLSILERETK
ncbi:hypothetical protein ACIQXI_01505 [Lysinibacillus sp. NPDC097195]|uniref:hypothetical protein n=1 Tax=Lysinibacillus sp. NPDC097195 TaxID=3364141 RepID=UPI003818EFF2